MVHRPTKHTLTEREQERYIATNAKGCPACGSDDIYLTTTAHTSPITIAEQGFCHACHNRYELTYTFTHVKLL